MIFQAYVLRIIAICYLWQLTYKLKRKHVKAFKGLKAGIPEMDIFIILTWDAEGYNVKIIYIHGNIDHTLPIRKIYYDYVIENG